MKLRRGFLAPLDLLGLLNPRWKWRLRAPAWAGAWMSALALVTWCPVRSCYEVLQVPQAHLAYLGSQENQELMFSWDPLDLPEKMDLLVNLVPRAPREKLDLMEPPVFLE